MAAFSERHLQQEPEGCSAEGDLATNEPRCTKDIPINNCVACVLNYEFISQPDSMYFGQQLEAKQLVDPSTEIAYPMFDFTTLS